MISHHGAVDSIRTVVHIVLTGSDEAPVPGDETMTTIYAIHSPSADKLAEVTAQMAVMGAPTIEVVDCGDHYMALEGSHRLAAAHALGLTPTLTIREQGETLDISGYDWFEACNWAETTYLAGEVAGELFCPRQAISYSFGG